MKINQTLRKAANAIGLLIILSFGSFFAENAIVLIILFCLGTTAILAYMAWLISGTFITTPHSILQVLLAGFILIILQIPFNYLLRETLDRIISIDKKTG